MRTRIVWGQCDGQCVPYCCTQKKASLHREFNGCLPIPMFSGYTGPESVPLVANSMCSNPIAALWAYKGALQRCHFNRKFNVFPNYVPCLPSPGPGAGKNQKSYTTPHFANCGIFFYYFGPFWQNLRCIFCILAHFGPFLASISIFSARCGKIWAAFLLFWDVLCNFWPAFLLFWCVLAKFTAVLGFPSRDESKVLYNPFHLGSPSGEVSKRGCVCCLLPGMLFSVCPVPMQGFFSLPDRLASCSITVLTSAPSSSPAPHPSQPCHNTCVFDDSVGCSVGSSFQFRCSFKMHLGYGRHMSGPKISSRCLHGFLCGFFHSLCSWCSRFPEPGQHLKGLHSAPQLACPFLLAHASMGLNGFDARLRSNQPSL